MSPYLNAFVFSASSSSSFSRRRRVHQSSAVLQEIWIQTRTQAPHTGRHQRQEKRSGRWQHLTTPWQSQHWLPAVRSRQQVTISSPFSVCTPRTSSQHFFKLTKRSLCQMKPASCQQKRDLFIANWHKHHRKYGYVITSWAQVQFPFKNSSK